MLFNKPERRKLLHMKVVALRCDLMSFASLQAFTVKYKRFLRDLRKTQEFHGEKSFEVHLYILRKRWRGDVNQGASLLSLCLWSHLPGQCLPNGGNPELWRILAVTASHST